MERNNCASVIRISSFPTVVIKHGPQFSNPSNATVAQSWAKDHGLRIQTFSATTGGNDSKSCFRRDPLKNHQPTANDERCESATVSGNCHLSALDHRLRMEVSQGGARAGHSALGEVRGSVTLSGAGRRVRVARVAAGARLCVVGDGAVVRVGCNEGEVRVVGAGGRVRIRCNARGRVAYVGEGGDVRAGAGGRVSCTGAGTRMDETRACGCCAELPPLATAAPASDAPFVYFAHRQPGQAKVQEYLVRPTKQSLSSVSVHMPSYWDRPSTGTTCLMT